MRNRWISILTLILAAGLLAAVVSPGFAQHPGEHTSHNMSVIRDLTQGSAVPQVKLEFEDASIKDAIRKVFESVFGPLDCDESGLQCTMKQKAGRLAGYKIDPVISQKPPYNNRLVSEHAQNSFEHVLGTMLDMNDLEASFDDKGFLVIGPSSSASSGSSRQTSQGAGNGFSRPNSTQSSGGFGASSTPNSYSPRVLGGQYPRPASGGPGGVTLDLENVPLRDALDQLFETAFVRLAQPADSGWAKFRFKEKGTSVGYKDYRFDSSMEKPPFNSIKVTLHAQNAEFEDVLAQLLGANDLVAFNDRGVYMIGPSPAISVSTNYRRGGTESSSQSPITMRIPAMMVKDAVAMVEPGWTFKGTYGSRYVQGASFYNFPKDMAVSMLLIAAGLKPPAVGTKVVSQELKGRTLSLSDLYQWTPSRAGSQSYSGFGGGGGFGGGYGGYGQTTGPSYGNTVAIGAYKRVSPKGESKWLFTVLASQWPDTMFLEKLMATSGVSYTMGGVHAPQAVSVQLYDVTLDQALDAILPMVGLKYRKAGAQTNPAYVIEPSAAPSTGKFGGSFGGGGGGGRIGF